MKVVINTCFGGFSLSRAAVKRLAELQGRPCYFFENARLNGAIQLSRYVPSENPPEDHRDMLFFAFDIPNPNEVLRDDTTWHNMSDAEKRESGSIYGRHSLSNRPENRADPLLVQVIEELGKEANGACAELKVVEIPDGVDYEIDEYDGLEHIAEKHRTWR